MVLRQTWAEVNLDHLRHNVRALKSKIAPHVLLMVSVKANGYGHGAYAAAATALRAGADQLGVATVEEGLELRGLGITAPILVYGAIPSIPSAQEAAKHHLMLTIGSSTHLDWCERASERTGQQIGAHVKVDTGMGRLGVRHTEEAVALIVDTGRSRYVDFQGVFTHFADAEEPINVPEPYTEQQRIRFDAVLSAAKASGIHIPLAHAANSAGMLRGTQYHYDMVRPGLAFYGYYPRSEWKEVIDLKPALSLYTTVVRLATIGPGESVSYGRKYVADKKETIATLPIGFADGVPFNLSNIGRVRINGNEATIAGEVCMDQMMIVATGIPAQEGTTVAVYDGTVECAASIQAAANLIKTTPYELLCRISGRVPRVYIGDNAQHVNAHMLVHYRK